jgi:hypothetical protein
VLAIGPKFRRFKTGPGQPILRAIKIRNTTSFGGEVKPSVPCRENLRNAKETYNHEDGYFVGKIHCHFSPSFSRFATRYVCWLLPENLVCLSGMIIIQMGMNIISEMAVVYGTPCAIHPRNCNSMCLQHMQKSLHFTESILEKAILSILNTVYEWMNFSF